MPQDIKVLFLLLIVILIMVVLMQNNSQNKGVQPEEIKKNTNKESFAVDNESSDDFIPDEMMNNRMNTQEEMLNRMNTQDLLRKQREMRRVNIEDKIERELDNSISTDGGSSQDSFVNPMDININTLRNNTSSSNVDNNVLEELIKEVNTGNDLRVNSTENKI